MLPAFSTVEPFSFSTAFGIGASLLEAAKPIFITKVSIPKLKQGKSGQFFFEDWTLIFCAPFPGFFIETPGNIESMRKKYGSKY